MVTKTELRKMNPNRPRVFKDPTRTNLAWSIERGRDKAIVSIWPSWDMAFQAAERMASMSTGFGLAV